MTPVPPMAPIVPHSGSAGGAVLRRRRRPGGGEEAAAVLGPGRGAGGVVLGRHADRLATGELGGERIGRHGAEERRAAATAPPSGDRSRTAAAMIAAATRTKPAARPSAPILSGRPRISGTSARRRADSRRRNSRNSGSCCWRLRLALDLARAFQALGARDRRHDGGEIGELRGLEGDELIARLRCLERAGRRLAGRDERVDLGAGELKILHDAGLDAHRVLESGERVLPARLRVGEQAAATRSSRNRPAGRSE